MFAMACIDRQSEIQKKKVDQSVASVFADMCTISWGAFDAYVKSVVLWPLEIQLTIQINANDKKTCSDVLLVRVASNPLLLT